ncbi:branched-chain amino acid ABC transporter permease [Haloprofundus marisrubri]|uniref:Branched-chain amino acid ABC transporter permease n=1 Tax=Haloprofundus marisrubri TaxID=1514971 RepID=A0A0W1R9Y1_9EURY|nr:branched-chain amino acid ABC transporter permease [Haloprofundus marisrubri]KTG10190.1 branched-chain amino acid ABC transporter permease [Haloprofundus marisrubri]
MTARDRFDLQSLGENERRLGGIVIAVVVLAAMFLVFDLAFLVPMLALTGMWALLALGLNVQWGYAGLINFSVAAFWGIGMYCAALVTSPGSPLALEMSPLVGFLAAIVVSAVVALLIGIPTLRLRADYLAIASLGLAEVIRLIILNERDLTAGSSGLSVGPLFPELPATLDALFAPDAPAFPYRGLVDLLVVLVLLGVVYAALRRMHRSPWGRLLRTIRSDEDLAKALGKNTYLRKMQAFVLGSVLMAIAGAFYAHQFRYVTPTDLLPIGTFYVWVAVILGGTGSNRGAVVGAFAIIAIREGTRFVSFGGLDAAALRLLLVGLLIIVVVRFRSSGLLPPREELIWPSAKSSGRSSESVAADGGGENA